MNLPTRSFPAPCARHERGLVVVRTRAALCDRSFRDNFTHLYLHQQFPSSLSRQRRRPSPPVTRVTPRRVLLPSHTGGLCYLCSAQSGVRSDVVDDHAGYVEKPLTTHPCPQGLEVRKTLLFLLTQILTQKCRR